MHRLLRTLQRVLEDVTAGRHLESYVVVAIGLALIVLDVVGTVDQSLQLSVMIAALLIVVFRGTAPEEKTVDLDAVLHDRQSFGPFRETLHGASTLWVYGPSAVNVLRSSTDVKREIVDRGGAVRVLLQDPANAASMDILRRQLDKNHDLKHDIDGSLYTLARMADWGGHIEWGLIDYTPGFSLVVVDPHGKTGRVIVEFFGFQNDLIDERMHLNIGREESQFWFEYWVKQYEIMWDSAHKPQTTGS